MLTLRDGTLLLSHDFQEIIDDFNKRQEERIRLLIALLNEQEPKKKKKNRRKMRKHGQII